MTSRPAWTHRLRSGPEGPAHSPRVSTGHVAQWTQVCDHQQLLCRPHLSALSFCPMVQGRQRMFAMRSFWNCIFWKICSGSLLSPDSSALKLPSRAQKEIWLVEMCGREGPGQGEWFIGFWFCGGSVKERRFSG